MGAFLDLFRVLYEPGAVFGRVAEKPRFLAPFIGIAILAIIITYLMLPYQQAAMASQMAQLAQTNPAAAENAKKFGAIGLIFVPIVWAVILVIVATILWVLTSVFGGEGKWGTLLSVATYTSITALLLQAVGVVVLMMKGVDQVSSPLDLQPPLGLNLLAPETKGFVGAVLAGINPFGLWSMVLNAIGIQVTHKTTKGTAYAVSITAFVLFLVLAGAAAAIFKR